MMALALRGVELEEKVLVGAVERLEGAVDDLLNSPALPLVVVPQPLGLEARLQRPSDVGRAERAQLLFRGL